MMPWHFAFLGRIALFLPFAPFCPASVFLSPQHRAHFATFSFHIFVSFFGLTAFQVLRRPLQCLSSRDRRSMKNQKRKTRNKTRKRKTRKTKNAKRETKQENAKQEKPKTQNEKQNKKTQNKKNQKRKTRNKTRKRKTRKTKNANSLAKLLTPARPR